MSNTELVEWWLEQAGKDAELMASRASEYGAVDLFDLGHDLARLAHVEVTDSQAIELGIYFYVRGKMARWSAAILEGRQVSDDTLSDIGIYVRMVQRVRATGAWPGYSTAVASSTPTFWSAS